MLRPGHPLQPVVEEMQRWLTSALDMYESREEQRRGWLKRSIAAVHTRAQHVTRQFSEDALRHARDAQSATSALKAANDTIDELRRTIFDERRSSAAALATAQSNADSLSQQLHAAKDRLVVTERETQSRAVYTSGLELQARLVLCRA